MMSRALKSSRVIRYDNISDVHTNHPRTKSIFKGLRESFKPGPELAALDMIMIHGDFFDSPVGMGSDTTQDFDTWAKEFLTNCKRHDVIVRILEGTPSHDWWQSYRFVFLNELMQIGCDVRYFDTLSIEYIERLDLHVLYVPDEYRPTPEETLAEVKDLMAARGLTQVDIASMHGVFDFQLPPNVKGHKHDSSEYLKLVRYAIHIGHHHIKNKYKHIFAQGSFDRLSHNEEGAKGKVRTTIYTGSGEVEWEFIENKLATKYLTIDCVDLDIQAAIDKAGAVAATLAEGFIRLSAYTDSPIFSNMVQFTMFWPHIVWSKHPVERPGEAPQEFDVFDDEEDFSAPITISKDNVLSLLMPRITSRATSVEMIKMVEEAIKELA